MHRRIAPPLIAALAFLIRTVPALPGRWRLIEALLPRLRRDGNRMGRRIITLGGTGLRFECDLADWLGQYVYLTGSYEPATVRVLVDHVRAGDCVLDVGANVGVFTLLLAALVGPRGSVHAIEPVPALRSALKRQLALNPGLPVSVHAFAAADRAGTATLHEGPAGHAGLSSLRPLTEAAAEHRVRALPIDDLGATLPRVALVKLDVEGAELKALRGIAALIERDRPLIVVEVTDRFLRGFGDDAAALLAWLRDHRYRLHAMTQESETGLRALGTELPDEQLNCFAVPEECAEMAEGVE